MTTEMLQHFSHGPEPVRAAVERAGPLPAARLKTGVRKVVRVHELIDVFPVVEHRNVPALVNPLEENLEDAQAAVTHDGTWPRNRNI